MSQLIGNTYQELPDRFKILDFSTARKNGSRGGRWTVTALVQSTELIEQQVIAEGEGETGAMHMLQLKLESMFGSRKDENEGTDAELA